MASLRKKYQGIVDNSNEPVTTAPIVAAEPPPATDAPKPVEEIKTEPSPVEEAAQNAVKQRLAEAERAQELAKTASPPQQQFASEPPQQQRMDPIEQFEQMISHLPERVRSWYRVGPEFLDERAAQIQYAHHVVRRELGEEFTDPYYDRMEYALGLRHAAPQPEPRPLPERKASAPARQYSGAPVSAPPSRESHSMSTGRPVGDTRLTAEQLELARTLGLTPEQYWKGLERMNREKAGGFHQDGR